MTEEQKAERWIMYRAVLYNFWYYPSQELIFKDGCAVLRGHNGSGKSVTTQSLITVLLDGDTRSHKLDPFGGRERKISDTVLGEEELLPHVKTRIGYISMEFRKKSGLTKTIGIGIHASRDKKQTKQWYFILNGKTVGNHDEDVKLYKTEKFEGETKEISLSEKELRQLVEIELQCGKVYSNRDEYAAQVNKQLFGFETPEQFKGLIDLLQEIRSPQLSDRNKPEAAVYVLNNALPQLTEEELRPLTSSIESIDRLEKDLARYKTDLKLIDSLNKSYIEYNTVTMAEKADEFLKAEKQLSALQNGLADLEKRQVQRSQALTLAQVNLKKIENEIQALKDEKLNLGFEEIEAVQGNLIATEKEKTSVETKLQELEEKKLKAERDYREERSNAEHANTDKLKYENELNQYVQELKHHTINMDFEMHGRFFDHFSERYVESNYEFRAWNEAVFEYKKFLNNTRVQLEAYERKASQTDNFKNELGRIDQEIYQTEQQIDSVVYKYEQTIMDKRDAIELWTYNTTKLVITPELKQQLQVQIDELFDPIEKDVYFQNLNQFTQERLAEVLQKLAKLENEVSLKETALQDLSSEIEEWKTEKEVEPSFLPRKQKDWEKLRHQGIDFKPFYEVFEFKEHVTDEERLWLQSAFHEAGLLSAAVVEPNQIESASKVTAVVHFGNEKKNNLSQILRSSENNVVYDQMLKGISFDIEEDGFILNDGYFRTNFVAGKAAFYDENLYIGKEARNLNRLRKIAELEILYDEESKLLSKLKSEVELVSSDGLTIEKERDEFPDVSDLSQLVQERKKHQERIELVFKPEKEKKLEAIHELELEMKRMMVEIKQKVDFSSLDLTTKAFAEETAKLADYESIFQDLKESYQKLHSIIIQARIHESQMENFQERAEEYHSDFIDQEIKLENLNSRVDSLKKRLQEMGSEEIINRIREITEKLEVILPEQRDANIRETSSLERDIQMVTQEIHKLNQDELPFRKATATAWKKTFDEQFRQNRVLFENLDLSGDLRENAKCVFKQHGGKLDKNRDVISEMRSRLNKRFQERKVELIQYDLDLSFVPSIHVPLFETDDLDKQRSLNFIKEQMMRMTLTLSIHDVREPIGTAVSRLSEKISDLEALQTEKDRELFQDILCNTLADSIRRKIQYVETWEKEMNRYMEHENIIRFRIKWVPRASEKEGEMHTRKLVEELKKDSRWVDVSAISTHFKTKIKDAKRKVSNDSELNLQQIMRELLDYRSWFDFEIYFTKHGGKERRLNRNSYGELSGGQRVLAMVTPVLAALYSKYLDGKSDAPRIFTLDEAFARVDEENINVMFTYIHKLGFNYILNSQGLWGCFESVPSLNIYELSRPNNKPHVFVQSYYWNGNSRIKLDSVKGKSYATVGSD